jgi:pyridoxamine 5'-phosphate oxidase
MTDPIADLRRRYGQAGLHESDLDPDPIVQFRRWFDEARRAGVHEPNAMTLATATPDGGPAARMVLLKGVGPEGFDFYTNLDSRKGLELAANPRAALLFWWGPLERQVRIEGHVGRVPDEQADAYFATRPLESRIGAWASEQSAPIEGRHILEARAEEIRQRFPTGGMPRPPFWGGFRVTPDYVEFWQGRPGRLHDRLGYRRDGNRWVIQRLSP